MVRNEPILKGSNAREAVQGGVLKLWTDRRRSKFGISLHGLTNHDQDSVSKMLEGKD